MTRPRTKDLGSTFKSTEDSRIRPKKIGDHGSGAKSAEAVAWERLLLEEDVEAIIQEAEDSDVLK